MPNFLVFCCRVVQLRLTIWVLKAPRWWLRRGANAYPLDITRHGLAADYAHSRLVFTGERLTFFVTHELPGCRRRYSCVGARPTVQGYKENYASTLALARDWPRHQWAPTLQVMMSREDKTESTWGAIDALADLLNTNAKSL